MIYADVSRAKRAEKVDALAAAHILQGAIDALDVFGPAISNALVDLISIDRSATTSRDPPRPRRHFRRQSRGPRTIACGADRLQSVLRKFDADGDVLCDRHAPSRSNVDPASVEHCSVKKGETLEDTAQTLNAMRPDALVIRHRENGAPAAVALIMDAPVINAGDGTNEHPTQALLDAATIRHRLGRLEGSRSRSAAISGTAASPARTLSCCPGSGGSSARRPARAHAR